MPEFLEKKLRSEAAAKGYKGKRADKYVFSTLNAIGAMHGSATTAKGARMQAKHDAKLSHGSKATMTQQGSASVRAKGRFGSKPTDGSVTSRAAYGQHPHKNLGGYLHAKKAE